MAIDYPIPWPGILPSQLRILPNNAVALNQSETSFQQQTWDWQGDVWIAEVTYPPRARDRIDDLLADLTALRGPVGTILLRDPLRLEPRGSIVGLERAPSVRGGAASRARVLPVKGLPRRMNDVWRKGDLIGVGEGAHARFHRVLRPADSDHRGYADVDIWPRVREPLPDGVPVSVRNCEAVFRLAASPGETQSRRIFIQPDTLRLVEALPLGSF